MKKTFFLLTLLTALNAFSIPIQWRVKTGETTAKTFTAYHGETLEFAPEFVSGGSVITNLSLSIYWQTNGMDTVWWSAPGTHFTPAMDSGASDYRFFIRATAPAQPTDTSDNVIASESEAIHEEVIYRANGRIKLLPSPGFTPAEIELPARALDFATIDIKNAPWATPEDVAAAVAEVDLTGQLKPLEKRVEETAVALSNLEKTALTKETDPVWEKEKANYQPAGDYAAGNHNHDGIYLKNFTEQDPEWAREKGNYSLTSHNHDGVYLETETDPTVDGKLAPITTRLTTAEDTVAAWQGFWSGDDFKVTITNYPSAFGANRSPSGHIPRLYMSTKQVFDGEEKEHIVWDENWWHEWFTDEYLPANYFDKAEVNAALASLDANKADRAWGFYDSTTGAYAPEGYTQISSPNIMLSAGYGFQRTLTTTGAAYWVLTGNYTSGANTAAENGLFSLYDSEGNAVIQAYKGDKQLVGADPDAISTEGTTLIINYPVEAEEHPILYLCDALETHEWKAETDPDCVATVTWSGTSGAYVARATPKVAKGKLFAYAQFYQGGESYIDITYSLRRIKIGNTLYTVAAEQINGKTVLTLQEVTE